MSGLYTIAQIARYFGSRPQEVARMIKEDSLPVLELPGERRLVKKIALHGLHGWLAARHSGAAFMTVDQLAAEIEAAQSDATSEGLLQLRSAVETVFQAISREMRKEAA
jgi:ClpP class serine protease